MLFLGIGIGLVVGIIIALLIFRRRICGDLRVDTSDPFDGPYMFLELGKDVGSVIHKKYVVLKVNRKSYIPRR